MGECLDVACCRLWGQIGRLTMGSDSWSEWCDCELDGFKLPVVERTQAVVELAEHGLSNRAIAD